MQNKFVILGSVIEIDVIDVLVTTVCVLFFTLYFSLVLLSGQDSDDGTTTPKVKCPELQSLS